MSAFVLTQYDGAILGPIAKLLGVIMNAIYNFLEVVGIPNVGLAIILFTIVVNVLMLPLTIKQQKFSKMSAKMQPEIQAVQAKYKGKRDSVSAQRMNEEMNVIYEKYGTSPTGGCLPLLIQMPILFALFRVINNIPAYITSVKEMFTGLVDAVMAVPGYAEIMQNFVTENKMAAIKTNFETAEAARNTLIDIFYAFKGSNWAAFEGMSEFSGLTAEIAELRMNLSGVTNFLGLSMTETPWELMKAVLTGGSILVAIGALMIPILSGLSQYYQVKLQPQPEKAKNSKPGDNPQEDMMKSMNTTMPLMSAFFCLTFQIGLGLYWIAGAVVRMVIQILINKFYKIDVDEMIAKNVEKADKRREKRGYEKNQIANAANQKVRNRVISSENEELINASYNREVKAGSIADKARLVQKYNDFNRK